MISIVQEETLDESWIPVTEKEWREQQDTENELTTKKVQIMIRASCLMIFKHTLIYTFGKGFIDAITSFGNLITDLWVKTIVGIQYLIEQKGTTRYSNHYDVTYDDAMTLHHSRVNITLKSDFSFPSLFLFSGQLFAHFQASY